MKINKNALIHSYAQSMGIEAAKDLITKKIKSAALEEKEHYTEEEVAKICGELIKEGGLIRIVAQNFVVQLERKRSEEQALLLDNIETQIWYLTDIETYGAVNRAHAEFLGMEKGNLEGGSLYDIVGREEVKVCIAGNREVFEKKKQTRTEEWVRNGKGKTRLLSITRTPKIDDNGNVEYVICAAEDITVQKRAEEHIEHLNSVLKAIRDVNQVIIVEKDRDSLLQKACDVLIEARGYDAAWLGFLRDGETFAKVNGSGFREEFSRFREHLLGGEPPPCFKNALAQKVPFMLVDKSIQCGDCFFKNAHTDKEVAIIRVEHAGRLFGLLVISLASIVAADEEEKGILMEVAGDIGFALHDMEMEDARKRLEEELAKERDYTRHLIESSLDFQMTLDKDGIIMDVNEAFEKIVGKGREDLMGASIYEYLPKEETKKAIAEIFEREKVRNIELTFNIPGKETLLCNFSGSVFTTPEEVLGIYVTGRDITERKQAEDRIKASLKEKEVLLREIHHRVKNNLQIISSLLNMQARKAKDKKVIESLLDSRSRIQTMALIHAQLYQSENLEQVEMGTTIRKLVSFMSQIYAKTELNITSVVTAEGVILSISQAIPCGLIINELVSNALKHAFTGTTEGSIEISMRDLAGDKIKLTVKDNGVGIPEELDIYKTDTLGLKIVRTLVEDQLKGKMELIRNKGTEFYIEFDKSITNGK
jgi:PAS domain S-box-containing protein